MSAAAAATTAPPVRGLLSHLRLEGRASTSNNSHSGAAAATALFTTALNSDLRSVAGIGSLPKDVAAMENSKFEGPHLLQVDSIVNVACSKADGERGGGKRLRKFALTDGVQDVVAIEQREVDAGIRPGSKIVVRGIAVRRGLLLLTPDVMAFVGGGIALPTAVVAAAAAPNARSQPRAAALISNSASTSSLLPHMASSAAAAPPRSTNNTASVVSSTVTMSLASSNPGDASLVSSSSNNPGDASPVSSSGSNPVAASLTSSASGNSVSILLASSASSAVELVSIGGADALLHTEPASTAAPLDNDNAVSLRSQPQLQLAPHPVASEAAATAAAAHAFDGSHARPSKLETNDDSVIVLDDEEDMGVSEIAARAMVQETSESAQPSPSSSSTAPPLPPMSLSALLHTPRPALLKMRARKLQARLLRLGQFEAGTFDMKVELGESERGGDASGGDASQGQRQSAVIESAYFERVLRTTPAQFFSATLDKKQRKAMLKHTRFRPLEQLWSTFDGEMTVSVFSSQREWEVYSAAVRGNAAGAAAAAPPQQPAHESTPSSSSSTPPSLPSATLESVGDSSIFIVVHNIPVEIADGEGAS